MNYMVRCFRTCPVRYRTLVKVLTFATEAEMWVHIDRCPDGHEVRKS